MSETIAEPGKWQPIETAPKDGTKVDLWAHFKASGSRRVPDAYWNDHFGDWQIGQYNARQLLTHPEITHWMPLPPAPESQP